MFILPRPSRAGAAREGEGEQVSLTDEIERAREIMATVVRVDLAWKDCFPLGTPWAAIAKSRYLDTLDRAATSIVAVLRAAEAVVREHAPFDDECGCDYCCDTASEQGTCSFCALRRALEDCDEA